MMDDRSPLEVEIRRRITAAGPMPVGEYMTLCLSDSEHGYYVTRDPLGQRGDFITAPEVSQMFGELIGLWMAAIWKQMGAPENVRVIELGPGRGTLMNDALRAVQVMPEFRTAIVVHLVEISPSLRAQQERTLAGLATPIFWHPTIDDVPPGPAIIVANEFFDALPINQAVKVEIGWHERRVGIDDADQFAFIVARDPLTQLERTLPNVVRGAPNNAIFEWRSDMMAMEVGRRITDIPGAALVIDYGHAQSATGDTFQAISHHAFADPLIAPGSVDLTAHVDFQALGHSVEAMGAKAFGPLTQTEFLRRLGIETRAAALKTNAPRAKAAEIDSALARLTGRGRTAMGELFKAMAFAHPQLGPPAGFDA
jgi:NADH dehydrogenase [ubiquinone] 1 alpha subcomplex assembly factor 7